MSLSIRKLELRDFRSYQAFELEPRETLTVVVGPNAVGKTNVIEALQLVTAGDSFRHPKWTDCIRWGAARARVTMEAADENRSLDVVLDIREQGRRAYTVNGKAVRKQQAVAGVLPCVVFTPEDLGIVKDSAEKRRAAIDGLGAQLSQTYGSLRAEYERIVRQRNSALRDAEVGVGVIEAWTDRLVAAGAALVGHRLRLFERIAPRVSEVYGTLAEEEDLELEYVAPWAQGPLEESREGLEHQLRDALRRSQREEFARGVTVAGPHRDDLSFRIRKQDARAFASQGQQRTVALAWKLGEVAVIEDIKGQPPVLLLDDVMSELDESRRHELTRLVGTAAQTLITTTNLGYFDAEMVGRAKIVRLS